MQHHSCLINRHCGSSDSKRLIQTADVGSTLLREKKLRGLGARSFYWRTQLRLFHMPMSSMQQQTHRWPESTDDDEEPDISDDDQEMQDSNGSDVTDEQTDSEMEETDYPRDLWMIKRVVIPSDMDKLQYVGTMRLDGRCRDRQGKEIFTYGRIMKGRYEHQFCSVNQDMNLNATKTTTLLQNDIGAHNLLVINDDLTH